MHSKHYIIVLSLFSLINFGPLLSQEPLKLQAPTESVQGIEEHLDRARRIIQGLVKENKEVMQQFHVFAQTLKSTYLSGEGLVEKDIHSIINALIFSASQHRDQTRKNPEQTPYIIHPIGVADSLISIGGVRDPDTIIAGLLHDTVEDTDTSFEVIKENFGSRVEGFVREVTDNKSLPGEERKRLQIETAPHKSAGAAQIKLADKLYNMSSVLYNPPLGWEQERRDEYIRWGQNVVAQLPWVNAELKRAVNEVVTAYWHQRAGQMEKVTTH